jgi:Na+/H+-dicarboxylate symporter
MSEAPALAQANLAWWFRMSLTVRIFIGLAVGILVGLFFGDEVDVLQGVARGYIGLMQMTVLPYLVTALVLGLGRLSLSEAWLLAKYGGLTLLVFWALTLAVVALMPLTFPEYQSAFFFSTSLLHPHDPLSFVDLYIPANPFHSMANNIVPAVTLFSSAVGIALMGVAEKERFLLPLEALMKALGRVTHFVVELTPIGVIPIAAVAAGTLSPEELVRLQVYFIGFFIAALLIGMVLLPLLMSVTTPFRYREILGASGDALVTAFVTSNVFIVLPIIARHCERLAVRHGIERGSADSVPNVVVPIAFNFPTAGKLLTLLFVPFTAWLAGSPLEAVSYPGLMIAGLFSYFAKAQVALPFLMDLVEVPHDLFQLYIPTTLLNGKIDSAVGAISLFTFSGITAAAMAGRLKVSLTGIVRFLAIGVPAVAVAFALTSWLLAGLVDTRYTKAQVIRAMHLRRTTPPTGVHTGAAPLDAYSAVGFKPLERIRARGMLRVGYDPNRLPFTFFNNAGELVGLDVEMASQMANDLGVQLEFFQVRLDDFDKQLVAGDVDIVLSVPYTHHWVKRLRLSPPYMEATVGLLVRDPRRHDFATLEAIGRHGSLVVGIVGDEDLWEDYVRALLGRTPYTLVHMESWANYFDGMHGDIDAVIGFAEVAMAWSLLHPEFSVVIPRDLIIQRPLAIAMAPDSAELSMFVDEWVVLQKARGNFQSAYDYWVLGKGAETRPPRWSIARDVLGWLQ